jgi:hypothetical protein
MSNWSLFWYIISGGPNIETFSTKNVKELKKLSKWRIYTVKIFCRSINQKISKWQSSNTNFPFFTILGLGYSIWFKIPFLHVGSRLCTEDHPRKIWFTERLRSDRQHHAPGKPGTVFHHLVNQVRHLILAKRWRYDQLNWCWYLHSCSCTFQKIRFKNGAIRKGTV